MIDKWNQAGVCVPSTVDPVAREEKVTEMARDISVPAEFISHLTKHRKNLLLERRTLWCGGGVRECISRM